MKIHIPKEELQKNINLAPDWYEVTFEKFEPRPSQDKKSTNYYATFRFAVDGRSVEAMVCNSKLMQMMQRFIEAVQAKPIAVIDKKVQEDADFEPESFYGSQLKVRVEDEPYNGRMISKVKDFLPITADTSVPFGV